MVELAIRSCANARDLGGYDTKDGHTRTHRFVRCGGTRALMRDDLEALRSYGITRVLDLRSIGESPELTCRFSHLPWVEWKNVPLFDYDISAPAMMPEGNVDNYLVTSYLHMLTATESLCEIFSFFAEAAPTDCILFHCAAGMDRTGIVAMLVLGLAGVAREQIIADYCYSFGTQEDVDAAIAAGAAPKGNEFYSFILQTRMDAIATVYDTIVQTHGSVRTFLLSCGISPDVLDAVCAHACNE